MSTQQTIICHSFPAWDTPYIKSTVELMMRLSATHRVIFIDYHYTLKDLITNQFAPKNKLLGKGGRWRKVKTKYGEIEVYNFPPILPINWIGNKWAFDKMARLNASLIKKHIRKFQKANGLENATLINAFNPVYGALCQDAWKVNQQIYYCYDEISGTQWAGKHGASYEQQYLQNVDKVIVTSEGLKKTKAAFNPNCHVVKNGVNLSVFQQETASKSKSKHIAYIGAVDERIDQDLVAHLATEFSEYTFDFYGPVKVNIAEQPNLNFHGAIPQEQLPLVLEEAAACIIPFVKNNLTEAIYPLKVNEYLAMGKPVVSTAFADLSDFEKVIATGNNHEAFADALRKEIRYNSRARIQKRIDFAKQNDWEKRTEEFLQLLDVT